MPRKLPRKQAKLIAQIRLLRRKNNDLWMGVVALSMRVAPKQARALFRRIEKNDQKITAAIRETYGDE